MLSPHLYVSPPEYYVGLPGIRLVPEQVKIGKAIHLTVRTVGGAISGFRSTHCGITLRHAVPNADGQAPLCNHCGRAFHRQRKFWVLAKRTKIYGDWR